MQVLMGALRLAEVMRERKTPETVLASSKVEVKILEHGKVLKVSAGDFERVVSSESLRSERDLEHLALEVVSALRARYNDHELKAVLVELEGIHRLAKLGVGL
jgi:hypothetical protein